jgi:hypothetical protein
MLERAALMNNSEILARIARPFSEENDPLDVVVVS